MLTLNARLWIQHVFTGQLTADTRLCCVYTELYLEQDPHGAAGVSWVELQQLLLWTFGGGGEGATVTHISRLTLKRDTHTHDDTTHFLIYDTREIIRGG